MNDKFRSILSGTGFYAVLTVCLAAVGIGGYALLFRGETAPDPLPASSAEVVDAEIPADAPPAVETVLPTEVVQPAPTPDPEPEPEPEPVVPTVKPVSQAPVESKAPSLVVSPLSGQTVAAFSADQLAYNPTLDDWRTHDGIDIAAAAGTGVLAASAGTVLSVTDDDLLGTTVVLEHADGVQTTYACLQASPPVREGDHVSAGQTIGAVGATSIIEAASGPHLHFSVCRDGDLLDPEEYLKR